jgi:hypothetical protein
MPVLSKPSFAPRAAVLYVTIGALIGVWSGIWFWYMSNHPPQREVLWYWCWGFLLTGATLVVIGLALGQIGRAARHAELPPEEVMATEAKAELNAAARAPIVAPTNPAGTPAVPVATVVPSNTPPSAVPVAAAPRAKV